LLQGLQRAWAPTFSEYSDGFRPGRCAHQAVARAQQYLAEGYEWVVALDLEKCFDRVKHDKWRSLGKGRVSDRRVRQLLDRDLKAGALPGDHLEATIEGTPQGGPLSPLLANRLLDGLDKELERRGHRFVRDADESTIDGKRARAGARVFASMTRFLDRQLKRPVNQAKRAVARPWQRTFLGLSFTRQPPHRRRGSAKALQALKDERRHRTFRTRGVTLAQGRQELRRSLEGWHAYFGFAEVPSPLQDVDSWIRRRLRGYVWKQWGRRRDRALRNRGVSQELAWNTSKSAHGPWRLSRSPALAIAFPGRYFDRIGVPRLHRYDRRP
jgi:RNA-directed DNA polymerase